MDGFLNQPLYLLGPHGKTLQCTDSGHAHCANGNTGLWEEVTIVKSDQPDKYLIRTNKPGRHFENNLQCNPADGSLHFANKNDLLYEGFNVEYKGNCPLWTA